MNIIIEELQKKISLISDDAEKKESLDEEEMLTILIAKLCEEEFSNEE